MSLAIRGLYAILDLGERLEPSRAEEALQALLDGGAAIVQLRGKRLSARALFEEALRLRPLIEAHGASLIVNDRPDVALLAGASGVHLGQEDLPALRVAPWFGARQIGVSCHGLAEVEAARAEGAATYLGFGPIYPTRSKENPRPAVGLALLSQACVLAGPLPVVAIGGITGGLLPEVISTGVSAVAMIAALLDPLFERPGPSGLAEVTARTRAAVGMFAAAQGDA